MSIEIVETRENKVTTTLKVRNKRGSRQIEFAGVILSDSIGKRVLVYEREGRCTGIVDVGNNRTYISSSNHKTEADQQEKVAAERPETNYEGPNWHSTREW